MSDAIREQIVKVAKLMYEKGMVNAFAGNLSVRTATMFTLHPAVYAKVFKGRHDCENRYERKYTGRDVQAFV